MSRLLGFSALFLFLAAVGRYEDELIKRDGKWYILKRVRSE